MYVVNILNPLACLFTKLFFFDFLNNVSMLLHGMYNIYAINNPIQNGIIAPSMLPII